MPQLRTTIEEKFTSILYFPGNNYRDNYCIWIPDPKLVRNFRKNQEKNQDLPQKNSIGKENEIKWINHFLKQSREPISDLLAPQHLLSYFDEKLYWIAQEKYVNCDGNQSKIGFSFSIHELIGIARIKLLNLQYNVFERFDPKRGNLLGTYVERVAKNTMKEYLCFRVWQRKYSSDVSLLCNMSQSFVFEALFEYINYHMIVTKNDDDVNDNKSSIFYCQCCLAWYCFNQIYKSTTEDEEDEEDEIENLEKKRLHKQKKKNILKWLNSQEQQPLIESIAYKYNLELSRKQEDINSNIRDRSLWSCVITLRDNFANNETIVTSLVTCVDAIRHYISLPPTDSLYRPLQPNEDNPTTVGDTVGTEDAEIMEERSGRNSFYNNINETIVKFYERIPIQNKKQFLMSFGLSIAQEDIGEAFSVNQSKIHYILSVQEESTNQRNNEPDELRIQKQILLKNILENIADFHSLKQNLLRNVTARLLELENENINITLTLHNIATVSKKVSNCLVEYCLDEYSRQYFSSILRNQYQNLESDKVEIIQRYYLKNSISSDILTRTRLNISESESRKIIDSIKVVFHSAISAEIQRDLPLSLDPSQSNNPQILKTIDRINKRIDNFVDKWLEDKDSPVTSAFIDRINRSIDKFVEKCIDKWLEGQDIDD
jgi:hypothetical protein